MPKKQHSSAVFKPYLQNQLMLLPPSYDELIDANHLVRTVNSVVGKLNLDAIVQSYEGGGTSAYDPRMMVKVILYAYAMKIYTGRKVAKALKQDITFMWLSGNNRPDFRTINNFRSGVLKGTLEGLFKQMLLLLMEHGYVKMENYFCDGTTIAANGNKHKMVWKKNSERWKQIAEEKLRNLFSQIDEMNATEDSNYGSADLEEVSGTPLNKEQIKTEAEKLEKIIEQSEDSRQRRKAERIKKKVQAETEKINKYDRQLEISCGRSGFSKTDNEASAMRMKNEEILPAYNVLAGSENQFITGYSVHQNPNDGTCFKDHIEKLAQLTDALPKSITGDSIFGTQQNYQTLEDKGIGNYLKYPTFHSEKAQLAANPFHRDNFQYDAVSDTYTCPQGRTLTKKSTEEITHTKTGFISIVTKYKSTNCAGCPVASKCMQDEKGRKTLQRNHELERFKCQAKSNLNSEEGMAKRRKRSCEIESCFGDIKENMGFRRFHLRGKEKVKTEVGLLAMSHNLRKIYIKEAEKASLN